MAPVLHSLPDNDNAAWMVRTQLENRDVHDVGVKSAMARLPRERFIPHGAPSEAYADCPVPIGHGQTISQPYIVAVMTQELHLTGRERTLEIGTGSGYQTAVLACLCAEVFTIERIGTLLERSRGLLEELGFANIVCRLGDGSTGWPEHAPYDRIIVTAAAEEIPAALTGQLADNGILIAPVGVAEGYQRLVTVFRRGRNLETSYGLGCRFVPLVSGEV